MIPKKLKSGDKIRIVAPAQSLTLIGAINTTKAKEKLEKEGFRVTFSQNCYENDQFNSSSIEARVSDLHTAFSDPDVKAILTVIGGYNSNQLLDYLDYQLIGANPKILCGYSDITALSNAIFAKTGLITYSGPHFSTWAMEIEFDYNREYFHRCLVDDQQFNVAPSPTWSDDSWFLDQQKRQLEQNSGFATIVDGDAEGVIVGGHLNTFGLLRGTGYMPSLKDTILFIELNNDAGAAFAQQFDRQLQALIQQPGFAGVKGLVIGRWQKGCAMNMDKMRQIIGNKRELRKIPVIANVDFGHSNPIITFPIGGRAGISAAAKQAELKIISH